jgi:hypothetical protein
VGFSTEVAAYNALVLDRSWLKGGSNRTLTPAGDAVGQWSKMGLANVKAASPTPP